MQHSPKSVAAFEASNMDKALSLDDLPKTHVFPSLLNMNWEMVQSRCKKYQTEASQWVLKRHPSQELKWLRLPIHQACICDPSTTIITSLLEAYPKGVYETDHQKRLPIHLACIHGASTYVIYILLTAFPDSVNEKDEWGKYPADYTASSTNENKAEVENLFHKGAHAYEFGTSEKVKVKELKDSFERRLVEASTGNFEDQISATDDIEIELEDVNEDLPAEVLMSRSIIRGLEEQLEAALKAHDDSRARADNAEKANGALELKVKALEDKNEDIFNQEKVVELERELSVVSARNSHMRYAFEKLEKAVLVLENGAKGKEEKLKEANAKILSLEAEREDERKRIIALEDEIKVIPELKETISELEKRNFELEENFYESKSEKAEFLIRIENESEKASKLIDSNDELKKRNEELENSVSSVENSKAEIVIKLTDLEHEIKQVKENLTIAEKAESDCLSKISDLEHELKLYAEKELVIEDKDKEIELMKNQLESLEQEKKELNLAFITTFNKNESLLTKNAELETEKKGMNERLDSYEDYHQDAEKRMDFLEEKISSLKEKNVQLSILVNRLKETY